MLKNNKKVVNEKEEYYVVESIKDNVRHIVEKKLLGIMLVDGVSLESVMDSGYVNSLGWHIGCDGKVYERHTLNDAGLDYQKRLLNMGKSSAKYLKALDEMVRGINRDSLPNEKTEIAEIFLVNFISKVYKYEHKEMKNYTKSEDLSR